jgi:excisionase family DNA binding protein
MRKNVGPDLIRVDEFATALGITPACVRRWILERRITTVKVGRLVRIPSSEVGRLVRSGLRPFQPAPHIDSPRTEVSANG